MAQNLIDANEEEWIPLLSPNGAAELPRMFYGKVVFEF